MPLWDDGNFGQVVRYQQPSASFVRFSIEEEVDGEQIPKLNSLSAGETLSSDVTEH